MERENEERKTLDPKTISVSGLEQKTLSHLNYNLNGNLFWMKRFGAFEMKNWIGWFCLTETSHSDSIMMQQMKRIVQEWMNAWMDEWMNFKEWVP